MTDLIASLAKILPGKAILAEPADRAVFEVDWRHLYHHPAVCVVLPETTEQVAEIVKLCAQTGTKIVPQGGNTGLVGGGVPGPGGNQIILSLSRMRQIRGVDIVGDTITVEAGVTLQKVQEAAAAQNRLFPVSIGAEGTAQIGGVISTNAGGVQVLSYGSMRAQVLGLEAVLADGRIWNGLRALRKDNTGFDLKQIFIGGEGMLGIVTAACLRLQPAVTTRATALAGVASAEAALKLFQEMRARAGAALTLSEFISGPSMELATRHVPTGHAPFKAPAYLLLELSSHSTGENISALLEKILAEQLESGAVNDAVIAQSDSERAKLLGLREAVPEGELQEGGAIKHDISVPLGEIPLMVSGVEALARTKYPDCRLSIFGHIGDGNLHINFRAAAGHALASLDASKAQITLDVENLAMSLSGSFSAEHGIGQSRIPGMRAHKSDVELSLMRALKIALDPAGLLNPGKMLPGDD
jgi:FAD/FMN-containing dehydrogenase